MPIGVPFGFDRADGVKDLPISPDPEITGTVKSGTPTPAGAVNVQSYGGDTVESIPFEEKPDSPRIERAEQATVTHEFTGSYLDTLNRLAALGRFTMARDSDGFYWRVLSSEANFKHAGACDLKVVSECLSWDTPPEEFQIVPVELGLNIMKHPRYFDAFLGDGYGSATELKNQMVVRLLQDYFENPSAMYRDALIKMLERSIGSENGVPSVATAAGAEQQPPERDLNAKSVNKVWSSSVSKVPGTDLAKRAAQEIIMKYWRGEEQPYVVGWQMVWSLFFWKAQFLNPGGYIEDPILDGQLNPYFWSPTAPWEPADAGVNIFSLMAQVNPQCYSNSGKVSGDTEISWLRKADQQEFQRTWFKVTRTWIGAPVGHWDVDLYTQGNRPTLPNHYRKVQANAAVT